LPIPSGDSFFLPIEVQDQLNSLVDQIEANPGRMIEPGEYTGIVEDLDVQAVLTGLKHTLSRDDLAGILKLALLTESATESYAAVFADCSERYDAGWLGRFTSQVWTPDELTHHLPYKRILMDLGYSEGDLDRQIKQTREREYVHRGGKNPVQLTTFGMIQEVLTDSWHGLIANLLATGAPAAALMVRRVKRRETLHAVWYRQMTEIQLRANPRFVHEVASEISKFDMPSVSLVPELQEDALRWQMLMGADSESILRDLIRYINEALGSVQLLGELALLLAVGNSGVTSRPAGLLARALLPFGRPTHELVGQALLERVDLGYVFRDRTGRQERECDVLTGLYERIRAGVRRSLARMIPPANELLVNI